MNLIIPNTPETTTKPEVSDFTFTINANEPIKKSEFDSLKNSGTLVTVMSNGIDVTNQSDIKSDCTTTSCFITVKYKDIEKSKVIKITE